MLDETIRVEAFSACDPIAIGSATLLPVVRTIRLAIKGRNGVWCAAVKEPYAVIVRERSGGAVFGIGAGAASIEQLRAKVSDLDDWLARI
jgi:hypothetical protein